MTDKFKDVPKGDDGKPTKAYMKWAFENDKELFMDLQNEYFTTKANMNPDRFTKKSKAKMKAKNEK